MDKNGNSEDLFRKFFDIMVKADEKVELKDRAAHLRSQQDKIKKLFKKAKDKNGIYLGVMLRILSHDPAKISVPAFTNFPHRSLCLALEENKEKIGQALALFNFERAKQLRQNAKSGKAVKKYTDRHRFLESAISLVWKSFDPETRWPYQNWKAFHSSDRWPYKPVSISERNACDFIAECYLIRSRLVLIKGETIPEKKLEAIQNAWEWANRPEKSTIETDDLRIEIVLEMERWDKTLPKEKTRHRITEFLRNNRLDLKKSLHWAVNHKAQELARLFDDKELFRLIGGKDHEMMKIAGSKKSDKAFLPLYQVNAALRRESKSISKKLEKAVEALDHAPFPHYLWNDTVDLIEKVKEKTETQDMPEWDWERSAIKLWEKCEEAEKRIRLSIQVRWHWAGYRKLYNLAFKAALSLEDYHLAVRITDSQKSRPTIKMKALENSW